MAIMKKIAELKVNNSADYYETLVTTIMNSGYKAIVEYEGITDSNYIIAVDEDDKDILMKKTPTKSKDDKDENKPAAIDYSTDGDVSKVLSFIIRELNDWKGKCFGDSVTTVTWLDTNTINKVIGFVDEVRCGKFRYRIERKESDDVKTHD